MEEAAQPRVVIVGGGFAGLYAAKALRNAPVQVTVVDRRNYHLFQPLLYQVATAALDASDIATPIRSILTGQNTEVVLADVMEIRPDERRVILDDAELPYDYLVLAAGATDAYFGHQNWQGYAPGLKSIEDALEIRRRVLLAFEEAEREQRPDVRQAWMTFVLIGGGPTGVELAGALAEVSHHALAKDFRHINPSLARIIVVESHSQILPFYPEALTHKARAELEKLGIDVRTGQRVTEISAEGVSIGSEFVPARTVLWGAGVVASGLGKYLGVPLDKGGRVKVTPELTAPGHDNIFVVGDLAAIEQDGQLIPGVASAAIQMGTHAAKQILRAVKGEHVEPFRYWDRGTFAVIGRGAAVGVAFRRFKLSGPIAWLSWLFIHLFFLVGFKNRVSVLLKWAYSYLTMQRGSRLITGHLRARPQSMKEPASPPPPASPLQSAEPFPVTVPVGLTVASTSSSLEK